jgi:tetratricopeptide (TPR) repeat protein
VEAYTSVAEPLPKPAALREAAQVRLKEAGARYRLEPRNAEAAWHFSRACFDLAEYAFNNEERARYARQGIEAGEVATSLAPNSAGAHYYLGMNLGQLARTKGLSALKVIRQLKREFAKARELDPRIDYGGPDRNLGLLSRDAPVILGLGNRKEARNHLTRAVELAPDYPENRLCLIEGFLKWGEEGEATREVKALKELWPKAREKYAGPAWTQAWADWEKQFEKLEKELNRRR